MNKYYHRGSGEVVVPDVMKAKSYHCGPDFEPEHIASLTPLPNVKCSPKEPTGFLEGYREQYEMYHVAGGKWHPCTKEEFEVLAPEYVRIFLIKQQPADPVPVEGKEEEEKIICSLDEQQCQQECKHKSDRTKCPFTQMQKQIFELSGSNSCDTGVCHNVFLVGDTCLCIKHQPSGQTGYLPITHLLPLLPQTQ